MSEIRDPETVLADALEADAPVAEMNVAARRSGNRSLSEQANEWVRAGITDQAEIYRVLGSQ